MFLPQVPRCPQGFGTDVPSAGSLGAFTEFTNLRSEPREHGEEPSNERTVLNLREPRRERE
jgi:hypothetical protein